MATETQIATETTGAELFGQEPEEGTLTEETEAETITEPEVEPTGVKKRIGALLKKN